MKVILRSNWTATAIQIEGFSGCCNPAHFTFLEDGSFVTSEKGLVRIKIYEQSGKFKSVVAAPNKFKEDGHAPDIAADSAGNIYALDFDSKMVRVFELKQKQWTEKEFIKTGGRSLILGAFAVFSGYLILNNRVSHENACPVNNQCSNCNKLSSCKLPQASRLKKDGEKS